VNGCYNVVTDKMSEWSVAGLECRALHKDAHLLVINNAAEQAAVAALLAPIKGKHFIYLYDMHRYMCTGTCRYMYIRVKIHVGPKK